MDAPTSGFPRASPSDVPGHALPRALVAAAALLVAAVLLARTAGHDWFGAERPWWANPYGVDQLAARDAAHLVEAPRADPDQPLARASHRLALALGAESPSRHRLWSVLLFAATGVLLYGALARLGVRRSTAAAASLLVLVHPLALEPVVWISMRGRVLAAALAAAALWCWSGGARARSAGALAFVLALASHPLAAPVPLLFAAIDRAARRSVLPALGLGVLAAGAVGLAWSSATTVELGWTTRSLHAAGAPWRHLAHAFVPGRLAIEYPHPALTSPSLAPGLAGWIALVASLAAARVAWRRASGSSVLPVRELAAGWAWFASASTVAALLPYGGSLAPDRDALLALPGLCLAAAGAIDLATRPLGRVARRTWIGATAALVAGLASASWRVAADWQDTTRVAERALASSPDNFLAARRLGHELIRRGKLTRATDVFRSVLDTHPDDAPAYRGLGIVALRHQRSGDALPHLARAVELDGGTPESSFWLATAYLRRGDASSLEPTATYFGAAVEAAPRFLRARTRLAVALVSLGQYARAREHAYRALALEPDSSEAREAHLALGLAAEREGDTRGALAHYERALAADGDYAEALSNLGRLLFVHGDQERALAVLERGCFLHPLYPDVLFQTATAYRGLSRLEDAVLHYRRTLNENPRHMRALVGLGRTHLELGHPAQARKLARAALAINPEHARALQLLREAEQ